MVTDGYHCFCPHYQGSSFFWNVGNHVPDYVMFQRIIIPSLSGSGSGNILWLWCFEVMEIILPLTHCHITENFNPEQYMFSLLWESEVSGTASIRKSTAICILNNMQRVCANNDLWNEDSGFRQFVMLCCWVSSFQCFEGSRS
jgi:hypothetical protein